MTDWSELASKFKKASADARVETERATQAQTLVNDKGLDLWTKLRSAAMLAVSAINREAAESILLFIPSESDPSFTVVYLRSGKQRTAKAAFNSSLHRITISFGGSMSLPSPSVEYEIRAENDGSVSLHGLQGDKSPGEVVDAMLHRLL